MIDYLKGEITYRKSEYLVMDVHGVGYQVFVANPLCFPNQLVAIVYTHYIVREDSHMIFGFQTDQERDLFRLLLEVSGVGPKAGLAMIAAGNPEELIRRIQFEDIPYLTRIPGVGKKTAQRIILDLKDKLKRLGWNSTVNPSKQLADNNLGDTANHSVQREVIEALLGLGYNEEEASWAVTEALHASGEDTLAVEEWIKRSLRAALKT